MRRNGSICGVLALFVMAASAAAQEGPMRVTYDRNNIIRVNGKPFLPIAVWAQPEDTLAMWKALGVNLFL